MEVLYSGIGKQNLKAFDTEEYDSYLGSQRQSIFQLRLHAHNLSICQTVRNPAQQKFIFTLLQAFLHFSFACHIQFYAAFSVQIISRCFLLLRFENDVSDVERSQFNFFHQSTRIHRGIYLQCDGRAPSFNVQKPCHFIEQDGIVCQHLYYLWYMKRQINIMTEKAIQANQQLQKLKKQDPLRFSNDSIIVRYVLSEPKNNQSLGSQTIYEQSEVIQREESDLYGSGEVQILLTSKKEVNDMDKADRALSPQLVVMKKKNTVCETMPKETDNEQQRAKYQTKNCMKKQVKKCVATFECDFNAIGIQQEVKNQEKPIFCCGQLSETQEKNKKQPQQTLQYDKMQSVINNKNKSDKFQQQQMNTLCQNQEKPTFSDFKEQIINNSQQKQFRMTESEISQQRNQIRNQNSILNQNKSSKTKIEQDKKDIQKNVQSLSFKFENQSELKFESKKYKLLEVSDVKSKYKKTEEYEQQLFGTRKPISQSSSELLNFSESSNNSKKQKKKCNKNFVNLKKYSFKKYKGKTYENPCQISVPQTKTQDLSLSALQVCEVIHNVNPWKIEQKIVVTPQQRDKNQIKGEQNEAIGQDYSMFYEQASHRQIEKSIIQQSPFQNDIKDLYISRTKVMTEVLLDKISQLESKVRHLESQKKTLKQSKITEGYQSSPITPHSDKEQVFGLIKKNAEYGKKLSSVSETVESSNNNFRVRSFSRNHSNSANKLYNNIVEMRNFEEKQTYQLKQEINFLKNRLKDIEKNRFVSNNKIDQLISDNSEQILGYKSEKKLLGKIRKNIQFNAISNFKFEDNAYSDISSNQKHLITKDPHSHRNFYKQNESITSSMLPRQNLIERNRIDSSALFRRQPNANNFERSQQNKVLPKSIEFNPQNQKFQIIESHQTQEINKNQTQPRQKQNDEILNFCLPQKSPNFQDQYTKLVEIGKQAFANFGHIIDENTVLNVKKYRDCVHYSIEQAIQNILWRFDGKFYYGGWRKYSNGEGSKEGQGIQILPGKYRFKGHFIEGKRNGFGVLIMQNGTKYYGHWEDGLRHGTGTQKDPQGFTYEGQWKEGKKSGFGKIFNKNELQFEGVFLKGMKNGFGKELFGNGDSYEGNYLNNKFDGKGAYFWSNGASYIGEFSQGKRNGEGVWKSGDEENEDIYEGQYLKDKKNGFGKYRWGNGVIYEGHFKNDLKHGQGKIIYENGKTISHIWEKGHILKNESKQKDSSLSRHKKLNTNKNSSQKLTLYSKSMKSNFGVRSTQNLQSAKSSSTNGGLPKGITMKSNSNRKLGHKKVDNLISIKVIQAYQPSKEFEMSRFKRSSVGKGPQEPQYKGLQSGLNTNLHL